MNKIFLLFGIIFTSVGGICLLAIGIPAYITQDMLLFLIGLLFAVVFGGVGIGFLIYYNLSKKKLREVIELGTKYWGRIVEYGDDTSFYVNGVPGLDVFVECDYNGEMRTYRISTRQTKENLYPLGATCQISIYNDIIAIVPGSIQ